MATATPYNGHLAVGSYGFEYVQSNGNYSVVDVDFTGLTYAVHLYVYMYIGDKSVVL